MAGARRSTAAEACAEGSFWGKRTSPPGEDPTVPTSPAPAHRRGGFRNDCRGRTRTNPVRIPGGGEQAAVGGPTGQPEPDTEKRKAPVGSSKATGPRAQSAP